MRPVERRPPRPAGRPPAAALLALALGAPPALAACAYRLERQDVFTFESPRQGPPPLSPAAAAAGWTVVPLDASLDGRPLAAFVASRPGATATLLFLNGNGYAAARALEVLLPKAEGLGLDVVVLDYRPPGAPPPAVAWVRRATREVLARAAARTVPAAGRVLVGGHSLGGWFALDLAAEPPVAGVFVVGAGTTPAEVGDRLLGAPLRWLVRLRPDDDLRALDAPALATLARAPVLVVGSARDSVMSTDFSRRIHAAVPEAAGRRLVLYEDVGHGGYMAEPRVWAEVAAWFGLPRP